MRDIVVAVDLETTGLDSVEDRIIEIGAVKFREGEILDQWSSYINPGRQIPAYITQLTGITNADVAKAPPMPNVQQTLRNFIGDAPILGHNVRFDVSFLQSSGLRLSNPLMDTYSIASAMLPAAPRYSLGSLAALLEIPLVDAHRALNDAMTTAAVYQELWRRSANIPIEVLAEIVRAGKQQYWDGGLFFEAALKLRTSEAVKVPRKKAIPEGDEEPYEPRGRGDTLRPSKKIEPLDNDEMASMLEEGGLLSNQEDFEYRPQQVEMLRAVVDAFNKGQHTMVEAPTGVGKSLAYLIPAITFGVKNSDRVVVSTNTITLQDQLINKDIPLLHKVLKTPFRATVLKGRSNYLCPRRLAALRRRGPTSPEEMLMLARILIWQLENKSGDRGDITLRGPAESAIWQRLSAEDEGCKTERCATLMEGACPFYQARQMAENAHLLIVNHALLLSDVVAEGRILPDYKYLIVDEAHHLEDATTNGLAFRTDPETIRRQLGELGSATSGLLGEMLRQSQGSIPPNYYSTLNDFVGIVVQASTFMLQHVDWFFVSLKDFITRHVKLQRGDYAQQIRIVNNLRQQAAWAQVETAWGNLGQFTSSIADAMTRLEEGLRELGDYDIEDYEDLQAGVSAAARHLTELHQRLDEIVSKPDGNTIYWAEISAANDRISLHAAPLDIGPLVEQYLWNSKDTVVMTSATLQTNGSFSYVKSRLAASHVSDTVIGTPFDYKSSTLLYLVNDIPEPADQMGYQAGVEQGVFDLCTATDGRALVLFTSYAQLRETASALGDRFSAQGITLYDQTNGTSRGQMLEGFINSEKAVLMGTRSFWEGVDVPGANLSVLIITRLPFSVPSDPIFAARSERFDDPFAQYSVPETILRFRQGFGRLIRRRSDRGVVAIFDRRIISKRYGQAFIDSLPECTVRTGRMADLPAAATRWLESDL